MNLSEDWNSQRSPWYKWCRTSKWTKILNLKSKGNPRSSTLNKSMESECLLPMSKETWFSSSSLNFKSSISQLLSNSHLSDKDTITRWGKSRTFQPLTYQRRITLSYIKSTQNSGSALKTPFLHNNLSEISSNNTTNPMKSTATFLSPNNKSAPILSPDTVQWSLRNHKMPSTKSKKLSKNHPSLISNSSLWSSNSKPSKNSWKHKKYSNKKNNALSILRSKFRPKPTSLNFMTAN